MAGLRIIAGAWKGRRIRTPAGRGVRPTPERVREALFAILGERVTGAHVLDLFSGSGALGLEALSRGAEQVVFVECDPRALHALRANVRALAAGDRSVVVAREVLPALTRLRGTGPFDLVLADPPYVQDPVAGLLGHLTAESLLRDEAWVVVERSSRNPPGAVPPPWGLFRSARYGGTRLDFYRCTARESGPVGHSGAARKPGRQGLG